LKVVAASELPRPDPKEGYKSGSFQNYILIIIFIVLINLMAFEQGLVPTNVKPIQEFFGINEAPIGVIVGCYTLVLAVSLIFFGYLSDKTTRIKIMVLGGGIWGFFAIMSFYSAAVFQNIALFATFRIAAGLGMGCLTPVGISLLSDIISTKHRSKAFAVWGIATTIGSLGGALIGLGTYATYEETGRIDAWQSPFLFIGVVGLMLVAVLILFREPKRAGADDALRELLTKEELAYSYQIKRADLKFIYTRKSNFWLIINFVDTIYPGLLLLWIFDYLTESFGSGEGGLTFHAIFFVGVVALGFLVGTAFFAWLGDRKFRKGDKAARARIAVYCAFITIPFIAVGFIFPLSTSNFWWIAILISVGLAIDSGIAPNWYSTLIDVNVPENRSTMIATASFLDHIGRAIGQMAGGFMIVAFGSYENPTFLALQWATIFLFLQIPFWIPVLKHVRHDIEEVDDILTDRAKELKEKAG
jgi:MFS family permease